MTDFKICKLKFEKMHWTNVKSYCSFESRSQVKSFQILRNQPLSIITTKDTYHCLSTFAVDFGLRRKWLPMKKELVAGKAGAIVLSVY